MLVIGAGPIGLSVIEFVKLTGATITVLDMNQQRLDFCQHTMGVDARRHDDCAEAIVKEYARADRRHALPGRVRRDGQHEVDVRRASNTSRSPAGSCSSAS